jgi:hypothetical protein
MPTAAAISRRVLVSGKTYELWENPDAPFSCSTDALTRYAERGDWVSLFNALVLAGAAGHVRRRRRARSL